MINVRFLKKNKKKKQEIWKVYWEKDNQGLFKGKIDVGGKGRDQNTGEELVKTTQCHSTSFLKHKYPLFSTFITFSFEGGGGGVDENLPGSFSLDIKILISPLRNMNDTKNDY